MPKKAMVLYGIVLLAAAVTAQSSSAEEGSAPTPSLPSLARASAYFDSAQAAFDDFVRSICQRDQGKAALANYVQKLSKFHVELTALHIGKQERGFVAAIVEQLKVQQAQLLSMIQPESQFDLNGALEHLDRVVQLAEEKLNGPVPTIRWRYGWKPSQPEKRWETPR